MKMQKAIEALRAGKGVIIVDDYDRENEGDLIYAAGTVTPEKINFMLRHTSGIVCLSLSKQRAKELNLPLMIDKENNNSSYTTPFTVSIEAKQGVTTGVSAHDRCQTILTAVNAKIPGELARPGHVFPLIAHDEGVFGRRGHTEGSYDLVKLSGSKAGAVICELMNDDGTMQKKKDIESFSEKHDIPIVSIQEIYDYQCCVKLQAQCDIKTKDYGELAMSVFHMPNSVEDIVVWHKKINNNPLVRIHSSCFTGDIFNSLHCDCNAQLHQSLSRISDEGGVLIYLNQEGRGIGLANKIKAYALQAKGHDTVEANEALGFPADDREYLGAVCVLKYFDIDACQLMTNNQQKISSLEEAGIKVERVALVIKENEVNAAYLKTKVEKLGHLYDSSSLGSCL
jgi:3,4-dihydroxy 2-butanone 4-phosphate synthase / GTP cyclohydrolase II